MVVTFCRHRVRNCTPRSSVGLTSVAELRAGSPRRPYRGALAAASDECLGGSEVRPACRHAVGSPLPRNGPRVSSSAKLDAALILWCFLRFRPTKSRAEPRYFRGQPFGLCACKIEKMARHQLVYRDVFAVGKLRNHDSLVPRNLQPKLC